MDKKPISYRQKYEKSISLLYIFIYIACYYMCHNIRKRTFGYVHSAKTQISASESSLNTFLIASDAKYLHTDNEDSSQTARMRRLN